VVGSRYAEGKPQGDSDPEEVVSLKGTEVTFEFSVAAVGAKPCASPSYQSHPLADHDFFRKFGISLDALGVIARQRDAVVLKCESDDWAPPQSLILPLPTGNVLMLWKGVFLELKKRRDQNRSATTDRTLIKRSP